MSDPQCDVFAVNVEILKVIVSWWIDWDIAMYSLDLDKPAMCRNTAITEELGQVTPLQHAHSSVLCRCNTC